MKTTYLLTCTGLLIFSLGACSEAAKPEPSASIDGGPAEESLDAVQPGTGEVDIDAVHRRALVVDAHADIE